MAPTKVINSITLNMQAIYIIHESIISDAISPSTRTIYLYLPPIFCECCHAITLVFLLSNFSLKFYLRNPAASRGVSPSYKYSSVHVDDERKNRQKASYVTRRK